MLTNGTIFITYQRDNTDWGKSYEFDQVILRKFGRMSSQVLLPWVRPAGSLVKQTGSPARPSASQRFPNENERGRRPSPPKPPSSSWLQMEKTTAVFTVPCADLTHVYQNAKLRFFDPQFLLLRVYPTDRLEQACLDPCRRMGTAVQHCYHINDWNQPLSSFCFNKRWHVCMMNHNLVVENKNVEP